MELYLKSQEMIILVFEKYTYLSLADKGYYMFTEDVLKQIPKKTKIH
jgi:hypothetical protein